MSSFCSWASSASAEVAVDQAGHDYHAGAVNDGFGRLLGRCAGDGDDFTVLNAQKRAEKHLVAFVHGHNGDVGNQSVHSLSFHPLKERRFLLQHAVKHFDVLLRVFGVVEPLNFAAGEIQLAHTAASEG